MKILPSRLVRKPWGSKALPRHFGKVNEKVGEVCFDVPSSLQQILVKLLFTSDRLSIQVHPDDDFARSRLGHRSGKEECWFILAAEPNSKIGIGFLDSFAIADVAAAARVGTIENLIAWHAVAAGDFFRVPAGTVHAIGPGVTLIEIQQNSDTTFRLYDYGSDRELHLDDALQVVRVEPYASTNRRHAEGDANEMLLHNELFAIDLIVTDPTDEQLSRHASDCYILPIDSPLRGEWGSIEVGQCALASSLREVEVESHGVYLVVSQPAHEGPSQAEAG